MGEIYVPHLVAFIMLAGVAACALGTFFLAALRVAFGRRSVEIVLHDTRRP